MLWSEASAAYRGRAFAEAAGLFGRYEAALGGDGAARVLAERCERYAKAPPPDGWAGVEALTHK